MMTHKIVLCTSVLIVALSVAVQAAPKNVIQMNKDTEQQVFPGKKVGHNEIVQDKPLKVLSEKELVPPDHLDAVRLEQDGMLNEDFNKEIFLGEHEEIDDDPSEIAESKVKDIFNKVDTDQDGKMCAPELEEWIRDKTQEHFDEALQENDHIFKHMDPDGDGMVTWKEYYIHFLLAKGYPYDRAAKQVVDYDEIQMDYDVREALIKYKFKWTEADTNPTDNQLNKDEFLAFRHPEQSEQAMAKMVRTIMNALDKDGDDLLTVDEFVALPLGEVEDQEQEKMDKKWQDTRKEEFEEHIDTNKDGKVSIDELLKFIDPRNPSQTRSDVEGMLEVIDDNHDKCISWEEILNHRDFFIESKVISVKRILHDEF